MNNKNKSYFFLALAICIGLLFHGAALFTTLETSYDIYVHIFFADHYANSWFEPWEPRWYTGFSLFSYPPLVHQSIALFSFLGGLKFGAYALSFGIIILYLTGMYRFSKMISLNDNAAGFATLIAVFLPSVIETFHVFGQLPMMMGLGWLLHALPEIYMWVRYGKKRYLINGLSLIAVAVCSHHVTPIFGMIFFVLPVMGLAVMDKAKEETGGYMNVTLLIFLNHLRKNLKQIVLFGILAIAITIIAILPYWLWSKNDPITQVPIPHGSRDNFLEVFSSGLVFFLIPWGFILTIFPFLFYRFFSRRNFFLGLSFTLLFILGTGGTTPIPKLLMGENAFSILTLERFTFWGTILATPFVGEFLYRFFYGNLRTIIIRKNSTTVFNFLTAFLIFIIFISAVFTMNLRYFRPTQPAKVELTPILNFLNSDNHSKWRYLTLGFGDQMAWLSANTTALTVDGNYHSARRIPELTTRAVERLENSKYRGVEGLGSLEQFLTVPEKYNLKYIFSNDKFYDPILYFNGWHRVRRLDNGIMVWEKEDVPPLPSVLPKKDFPIYQKVMWGTIPVLLLILAFFYNIQLHWINHISRRKINKGFVRDSYSNMENGRKVFNPVVFDIGKAWLIINLIAGISLAIYVYYLNLDQLDPERTVIAYYDSIDFKEYEKAHTYIADESNISLDDFLLIISVEDGIIDSYGKINTIETEVLSIDSNKVRIQANIEWITPLKSFNKVIEHDLIRKNSRWYILKENIQKRLPSDQFLVKNNLKFYNQGRRRITTTETFHEDILDRPVLQVLDSRLVQKDDRVFVIGLVQNTDHVPADITLKASLIYEDSIISNNSGLTTIHKILPGQMTAFRIDFKDYLSIDEAETPLSFEIEGLAVTATQDLYRSVALNISNVSDSMLEGELYNFGSLTVTIPQLVLTYFDKESRIIWVDYVLAEKSIRPQRREQIKSKLPDLFKINILQDAPARCKVNGLDNGSEKKLSTANMILLGEKGYLKISINPYIDKPSVF